MAAGDFSCADLQEVLVEVDRAWADNQINRDYMSYAGVLAAVKNEQTARLTELENPEKDNTVKLYWPVDCDDTLEDCDDDCTIGGAELEAKCKEYTLDICKTTGFNVKEKVFRASNLTREQVVARGMLKRMKLLDEFLARTIVAKLNAFTGTNQFAGIGTVVAGTTYVPAALWTADIMGYFVQAGIMNKFASPYLINGTNLWQMNWQAQFNNLNQDQKDQLAKMQTVRTYWDPFNIDAVNVGEKATYMIDRGAVAFVNKAYYPLNAPVEYIGAGQTRYSVESRNIPGVFYDVVYTNECVANEIIHKWSLYVKAGVFQNPFGCNEDVTGVIKFVCGAVPVS